MSWIIHVFIFVYIYKHGFHILSDDFSSLSRGEKNKAATALFLFLCLIIFWFWKFLVAAWKAAKSKND